MKTLIQAFIHATGPPSVRRNFSSGDNRVSGVCETAIAPQLGTISPPSLRALCFRIWLSTTTKAKPKGLS
ncbi:hypothetical protein [Bradyrhizobium sp. CCBAU 51627]|uniref:hypothetical protein n=1 Tax=Bradyrhizobium sp. CCBAU 51627 TaxID=1325088 RepID=UPI0023056508|nr:hypothetical protein [Bradyrhizobium sp. CCBAU 51627]